MEVQEGAINVDSKIGKPELPTVWKREHPHPHSHSVSHSVIPLDVQTATVSRKLGLLERKQNDRKTVEEFDGVLRKLDPTDPMRYVYGLFGLGVEGY